MANVIDKELDNLCNSVGELQQKLQEDWNNLNNPINLANEISSTLSSFIDNAFEQATQNEDMVQVNSVLITTLAQIKNYLVNKPSEVKIKLESLRAGYSVYNSCLELINKSQENIKKDKEDKQEEISIGKDSEELVEVSSSENSSSLRKIGERPESLRKIRQEMAKNLEDDS